MMEPTTLILGAIVALQVMYQAYQHFRGTAAVADASIATAQITGGTDMAKLIDSRVKVELDRQDNEIRELKQRVAHLERIEAEYRVAQLVMATNGITWPPEGAPKPTDEELGKV